mmetsp:Transcript_4442/g.7916  ORF Transcript_4442/g.7916 Transcript_4442/m.7916 type:complete len:144 (-) Transcript_4442:223-654(-)
MKRFSIATAFAVVSLTDTINAFFPAVPAGSYHPSSRLHSAADSDRIKKAGAGVTTQTPGDLCQYDPNEQGLLQGSNSLLDRIENGASFALSGAQETPPPPAPPTPTPPTPTPEAKPKSSSSNLKDLLNGQMEARFRSQGKSQG